MATINEKRKYQRVDISIPLRYKELHGNSYLARGTLTKNISEGGVRFTTDRFFALARRLLVEMNIPSISKPVKAISKVAWIRKLPVGDNYEIGNQFLAMTREDDALLSGYMGKLIDAHNME